jgi:tripartite-type tricarboxylate transporter receptor subunit TctC
LERLPQVPTVGKFVPGYEGDAWTGIAAPKNTPAEIIDKLSRMIGTAAADQKVNARIAELGVTAVAPVEFAQIITRDVEKWGKAIRAANIKAD